MKVNKSESKHVKKSVIAAAMIMGVSTMVFQGITQLPVAAEYNKTNTVHTNYVSYKGQPSGSEKNNVPKGYKKANYTIRDIDLEYYRNQKPADKDMTRKEAAEIGAQALWSVYGLSMEGKVIEMGYQPATDSMPRSSWYADVLIKGKITYGFEVDSVTGELFSLNHSRTLDKNVSIAFDAALDKNPQEYVELAKKTAEKLNVVHGKVAFITYNGQGYGNNDPSISLNVTGENGETALLDFSRYDRALLGIAYNASYKYTLEAIKKMEQEAQAKADAHQKSAASADGTQAPKLVITEEK